MEVYEGAHVYLMWGQLLHVLFVVLQHGILVIAALASNLLR